MTTWITRIPAGQYPAGMRVDVITLTGTGGAARGSRDSYLGGHGDGQWIRVRWPHGAVLAAMVRSMAELGDLGIEPGNLVAVPLACGQTTVYASGMTTTKGRDMKTAHDLAGDQLELAARDLEKARRRAERIIRDAEARWEAADANLRRHESAPGIPLPDCWVQDLAPRFGADENDLDEVPGFCLDDVPEGTYQS